MPPCGGTVGDLTSTKVILDWTFSTAYGQFNTMRQVLINRILTLQDEIELPTNIITYN